ncbi:MAG: ABC transporter substrate-binding protein [Candidatus Hydrogenedentes bacterium]|nr:ABC transporter substrate-binding protein [Candidatus Hydrogenedentota bacterium]
MSLLTIGLAAIAPAGCGNPVAPARPRGIITLAPHLTETVFALGQGSRVIGVGSYDDYPLEVAALPKVGGYVDPDLEKISLLNPELLIVQGRHPKIAEYAKLKGAPMLSVNMDSLDGIDKGIAEIGRALGCEKEADELRARIRGELDEVRASVAGLLRPKVLIITMRHDHTLNSLYTAHGGSFVSELVDVAGGDNIYADAATTYPEASKETVVLKAPEVILEFHAGEKMEDRERQRFIDDWRQLPSLPAVQNGRVYVITEPHAVRPGPRIGEIARLLAGLLHPDAARNIKAPAP